MKPTIAETLTHHTHMSPYQFQRWVFRMAGEHGWTGKEPSVLGGQESDQSFREALRCLKAKESK